MAEFKQKVIMAVGGHIGDMELTAGGTLATMALKGHKIVTVALTAGERGCPAGMTVAEYRKQKVEEARAFAEMLGGESVVFDYPDCELPTSMEVGFQLCDVIRKYRADVLLTPVGGFYTIDAKQAKAIIDQLNPRVVIPMHYKGDGFGFDVIAPVDDFLSLWEGTVKVLEGNTAEVTADTPAQVILPQFVPTGL